MEILQMEMMTQGVPAWAEVLGLIFAAVIIGGVIHCMFGDER